jgi:ech hydrogenase subunit D
LTCGIRKSRKTRRPEMESEKIINEIEIGALIENVGIMKDAGARLVQICCVKEPPAKGEAVLFELHYTFDKGYRLTGYKIAVAPGTEIPSITAIYPCAFLYENEMHDLFGVRVTDINIDYKGKFYKLARQRPFNPETTQPDGTAEKTVG